MVETLKTTGAYRAYIRSVLRLYVFMDAGLFDSDEADALREQMVEPCHGLSQDERKRMHGLVMDLNDLRESRAKKWPRDLSEKKKQEGLVRIREVYELKEAGKVDEALEHLRKSKEIIVPQFVWHFRGSFWNVMDIPEVAVEFYREASRLDPYNEKFKGVYLTTLKKTNFKEAKNIADKVMAKPERHDLTLLVYAADVEATSIRSELLELLAIAEASSGAPAVEVRKLFEQAIRTDITNTRAVDNLTRFEELAQDPTRHVGWRQESSLLDNNPERQEEKSFTESLQKDLALAA